MINVYALKGCDKCTTLINELKVAGISCNIIYDDKYEKLFDELEDKIDCYTYPIVEVHPRFSSTENAIDRYIIPSECKSKKSYIILYDEVYDIINILKTM